MPRISALNALNAAEELKLLQGRCPRCDRELHMQSAEGPGSIWTIYKCIVCGFYREQRLEKRWAK